jgi:hypothetical protein
LLSRQVTGTSGTRHTRPSEINKQTVQFIYVIRCRRCQCRHCTIAYQSSSSSQDENDRPSVRQPLATSRRQGASMKASQYWQTSAGWGYVAVIWHAPCTLAAAYRRARIPRKYTQRKADRPSLAPALARLLSEEGSEPVIFLGYALDYLIDARANKARRAHVAHRGGEVKTPRAVGVAVVNVQRSDGKHLSKAAIKSARS